MSAPRVLDLFSGAGIGGDGYARAGYEVTAVDTDAAALSHNPHTTIRRDALEVLADRAYLESFDLLHASPPCWRFTRGNAGGRGDKHPDLLTPTLEALATVRVPWIVENVDGAPMPGSLVLCGSEFGLTAYDPRSDRVVALRRHRRFLASFDLWGAGGCSCNADRRAQRIAGVYGGSRTDHVAARLERRGGYAVSDRTAAAALLGVDRLEPPPIRYLQLSIPPAYTHHLGALALEAVAARA